MKTYRPLEDRPSGLWLVAGWAAAIMILGGLSRCEDARGSEPAPVPPPVIAPMPRAKRVEVREASRHAAPVDGPMCVQEEIEPPPATHFGLLVEGEIEESERREVESQIARCSRFGGVKTHARLSDPPDAWKLLALLRLERDLGVPASATGLLGAGWCWESAFRSRPRAGDEGASHGLWQMQAWLWEWCGQHPSLDLVAAASCYWSRVDHYLQDGKCPGRWERAEAMAANGPKYAQVSRGMRDPCAVRSLHALELARWRKP